MEIHLVGAKFFHADRQMNRHDRRMDRHDEASGRFLHFYEHT